jgi:hypothetical protein
MQLSRKVTLDDVWMLEGEVVHPPPDLETWAAWMGEAEHVIRKTAVGPIVVKTLFMGFDMRIGLRSLGLPEVFLTVVGGLPDGTFQKRATTYRGAQAMHDEAIDHVKELLRPAARA